MTSRAHLVVLPLLLGFAAIGAARAAGPSPGEDNALLDGQAGVGARGRIAVNQAAGSGNAQSNLAAIAISTSGTGQVGLQARQQPFAGPRDRAASAQLQGGAFSGSQGLLSINQVAGSGNAQANLFAVGQHVGPTDVVLAGLDDSARASVTGDSASGQPAAPPVTRDARIGDGAFRGSQGVVQLNQTAGVGNLSTNAIVLQLPGGTP